MGPISYLSGTPFCSLTIERVCSETEEEDLPMVIFPARVVIVTVVEMRSHASLVESLLEFQAASSKLLV